MRTIGLLTGIAVVGLFACTTEVVRKPGGSAGNGGTDPIGTPTDQPATDPSTTTDPTDPSSPSPPLVSNLAITDVAFLQGVKVDVVKDGTVVTKRNAPVVAGRPALVRVFVTPGSGWAGREVTAELRLVDGTTRLPILKDTKTITKASTDEDSKSTFNFEVPATSLTAGVTYQVFLTATDGAVATGSNDARFPKEGGVQDLALEASGKLKIVVVPVQYDADGSGRVPDTSAAQLERYKQTFMARYPATEVEITAREPYSWTSTISANGNGFSQVLQGITNLRRSDGAASDVYYYGALAPTSSFNSFCPRGCVTGLSSVVENPKTSFLRASVGVGYPGQESVNTAAHEVGHAHGREHAPCGGAQGTDQDFPYSGGGIGVWGYDILAKTLISPSKGKDMMGYCPNEWVSDYTFTALFDRIAALNGNTASTATGGGTSSAQPDFHAGTMTRDTYRMDIVHADGTTEPGGEIDLDEEPAGGDVRLATFVSATGQNLGTKKAHFFHYDHLPGGVMVVSQGKRDLAVTSWKNIKISGLASSISR